MTTNNRTMQLESDIAEMIETNLQQRQHYDEHGDRQNYSGTLPTRMWGRTRQSIQNYKKRLDIKKFVWGLHREWWGDLTDKSVLDFGCYQGNSISMELAGTAKQYLGIDLSPHGIRQFQAKIEEREIPNAQAVAIDFLDPGFPYGPFDVIYANGVMHHFAKFEAFLRVLKRRLKPGGIVVSFDPLQTAWSVRLARTFYRPIQQDAAWEWPFTKENFHLLQEHFEIEQMQGVLGHAKWAYPLSKIPFCRGLANRLGRRLHERDLKVAKSIGPGLWRCMQVAMKLRLPESAA